MKDDKDMVNPEDIMSEKDFVTNLPVIVRTLSGKPPTEEQLLKLADHIRKARTLSKNTQDDKPKCKGVTLGKV